jgi:pentatricopeptide repeat protein
MKRLAIFMVLIFFFAGCGKKDVTVRSLDGIEPVELLQKGNEHYTNGELELALQTYDVIYSRYPQSREYISAVIGMAKCYNDMGDFEKGMDLFYDLVRENMVPTRVPEIFNEMAKYYEVNAGISTVIGLTDEEQDYKKAIDYYQKAVTYPNSDDVYAKSYAQFKIGELQLRMMQFKEAALAYQATVLNYPETEWADKAKGRITAMKEEGQSILSDIKKDQAAESAVEKVQPVEDTTPEDSTATTLPAEPDSIKNIDEVPVEPTVPDTSKPNLEFE